MEIMLICSVLALSLVQSVQNPVKAPPPGGEVMVAASQIGGFSLEPPASGSIKLVDVAGMPFGKALEIRVDKVGYPWDVETRVPIAKGVQARDMLLMHFWARTLETKHESGQGIIAAVVALGREPWTPLFERVASVGTQWTEFWVPGTSWNDYAPGDLVLKLPTGRARQTVQIGGIELWNYGKKLGLADLPNTRATYPGREPDAPWRKAAQDRIEQLRKADFAVKVVDSQGRAVPGATVSATLLRHDFGFGCAVFAKPLITQNDPVAQTYQESFKKYFNSGSLINETKWQGWIGEWGLTAYGRETAEKGLQWFKENDMRFRGHVMIWPSWHNSPKFLKDAYDAKATPQQIRDLTFSRIDEIAGATADVAEEWDVVNEPRDNHDLMDICGRNIMVDWFKRARSRMPGVALTLNDYAILTTFTNGVEHQEYRKNAKFLLDNGAPLDVFGFQGHFGSSVPGPQRILSVLDQFWREFKKPVRITEFTIAGDDESLKADFTRDFLTLLFSHPSAIGFQYWGLDEAIRADGSLTPSGQAYADLVKNSWHTQAEGRTGADGQYRSRGFVGTYDVKVQAGDKSKTVTFHLKKGGEPLVVTVQ